jgi:fatty acid desaturase
MMKPYRKNYVLQIPNMTRSFFSRIEFPTLALIFSVYAVLAALVWFHASLPWWFILFVGSYAGCLHSSLQHEVLHGHPTHNRRINETLVFVAPHLWLPYGRYRDLHLTHHNDLNLTCPVRDPESYYMLPDSWAGLSGFRQTLYRFNNTLFGRMLLGPAISVVQFWSDEFWQMLRGNRRIVKCWGLFVLSSSIVLGYVSWCGMPIWQYLLLVAYPAISLALVRSFCEHQAAEDVGHRTILVEAAPFWSLLFLNNNLHVAHHLRPTVSWYELPAYYRAEKAKLIARNGNYVKTGYGQIFWQYFFHAKEDMPHPNLSWLQHK